MATASPGQVPLGRLLFGSSWEDLDIDRAALGLRPGDRIAVIGSAGCNALGLLLDDPKAIHVVDINPTQLQLIRLKMAALRRLSLAECRELFGVVPSARRRDLIMALQGELDAGALDAFAAHGRLLRHGALKAGRFERYVAFFAASVSLLQGRRRVEGAFRSRTLDEQRAYYDRVFDTRRWRAVMHTVFPKRRLARYGLVPNYFDFDDSTEHFQTGLLERTRHAFTEIPITGNYFLARYFLDRYVTPDEVPDYLRAENFETVRERLDRIRIVEADMKDHLARCEPGSFDHFSLTNVFELKSAEDTERTFEQIVRTGRPGSGIALRNLTIPRGVPARLRRVIERDAARSKELRDRDRSFVYAAFHALRLRAAGPDALPEDARTDARARGDAR